MLFFLSRKGNSPLHTLSWHCCYLLSRGNQRQGHSWMKCHWETAELTSAEWSGNPSCDLIGSRKMQLQLQIRGTAARRFHAIYGKREPGVPLSRRSGTCEELVQTLGRSCVRSSHHAVLWQPLVENPSQCRTDSSSVASDALSYTDVKELDKTR